MNFRRGWPCHHFYSLVDKMDVCQINAKYLKGYEAQYNDGTDVGNTMISAQQDGFKYEGYGVPISLEDLEAVRQRTGPEEGKIYPRRFGRTKKRDYDEACFVMKRECCTYDELNEYRQQRKIKNKNGGGEKQNEHFSKQSVNLSSPKE